MNAIDFTSHPLLSPALVYDRVYEVRILDRNYHNDRKLDDKKTMRNPTNML